MKKERNVLVFFCKRTKRSRVLFCSLQKNVAFFEKNGTFFFKNGKERNVPNGKELVAQPWVSHVFVDKKTV